jgi:hypothetical protein
MIRSFSSFFSSHPHTGESDTGRAFETLKNVSIRNDLILLENATVFSRRESTLIPLLLFDPFRGFFVFDAKSWDYAYLKDCKAKASIQSASLQNNIRVDAHQTLITQKLNEVLHHDGCAVTNFVLFEKLTEAEFDRLDDSFGVLLPKHRVVFADESPQSILQKLHDVEHYYDIPLDPALLLGKLFVQFGILPDATHSGMRFATEEQREFITRTPADPVVQIVGTYGSGKSTALLLKAVYEKLKSPKRRIVLLEPTPSACEAQKRRLFELGKHALITFDDAAIEIMTTQELVDQHYGRLYKKSNAEAGVITSKMMKSKFDIADLLLCDDATLLDDAIIRYLIHIQQKRHLILAATQPIDDSYQTHALRSSFRCPDDLLSLIEENTIESDAATEVNSVSCASGNPYLHALVRLSELLQVREPGEILILTADADMSSAMRDEINGYFGEMAELLPSLSNPQYKPEAQKICITEIQNASGLENKAVILCGICRSEPELLRYALGRASESMSVILDESCDEIPPLLQGLAKTICQK